VSTNCTLQRGDSTTSKLLAQLQDMQDSMAQLKAKVSEYKLYIAEWLTQPPASCWLSYRTCRTAWPSSKLRSVSTNCTLQRGDFTTSKLQAKLQDMQDSMVQLKAKVSEYKLYIAGGQTLPPASCRLS
jgi:DNA-binding protein YbaB